MRCILRAVNASKCICSCWGSLWHSTRPYSWILGKEWGREAEGREGEVRWGKGGDQSPEQKFWLRLWSQSVLGISASLVYAMYLSLAGKLEHCFRSCVVYTRLGNYCYLSLYFAHVTDAPNRVSGRLSPAVCLAVSSFYLTDCGKTEGCTVRWLELGGSWPKILSVVSNVCTALHGNPSQSYRAPLAIWDHTVLPASQHKWMRPALTPARQAGTRFTYLGGMEGWVDLGSLIVARPGIKPMTAWSQVRCPNH